VTAAAVNCHGVQYAVWFNCVR